MYKFAVDCMGSDLGPEELAKAINKYTSQHDDVFVYAFGDETKLTALKDNKQVEVVDAKDVIPMECGAMQAARMKESSMNKAFTYYNDLKLDGIISAGSTGGYLTLATLKLKMIDGVDRAALISPFPTLTGNPVVILDIGASNENNPDHLVTFAKMGRIYYQTVFNKENPSTYLISNGTEDKKGSPVSKIAFEKLKEMNFPDFKGNMEARNALSGEADIIVCEGYPGNILLKSIEGTAKMMSTLIKRAFKRNFFSKIGYLLAKPGFDEMSEMMDYKKYGGAMFLGVNGVVVKAHGNSDEEGFCSAMKIMHNMAKAGIVNKLKEGLK